MVANETKPAPRILVVDDEPSLRRACAFTLRAEGWLTETEECPREALSRLIGGERFDAIVLDYAMPELNGLELLHELERARGLEAVPPVLLTSAHADGAVAWDALRFGVWDFLAKPLTPEELRRRVRGMLARPAAAAEGGARARALLLARKRAWSAALAALATSTKTVTETDELIGGLLAQMRGDDEAAQEYFRRAHWWPEWRRHGAEIWIELARRLDVA
jgi:two-component system response regulator AtoC